MHWPCYAAAIVGFVSAAVGTDQPQLPLLTPSILPSSSALSASKHGGSEASSSPTYRDKLLHLHRSLVSIESISGNEAAVGNFLVEYLTGRGFTVERQPVPPSAATRPGAPRFNVLARPGRGGSGSASGAPRRRIAVSSHIDVVPPHIHYAIDAPGGTVGRDTIIRGRGSADAKGSVASMVVALDELLAHGLVRPDGDDDVLLVFVVGEEITGDGMRVFNDSLHHPGANSSNQPSSQRFDAVIFGEPTDNRLACGHKGGLFCDVDAVGVPGHSGYPWLGKSATALMVRAMARLLDIDLGQSKLFGATTVNIGRFTGGVAANVIAEHAHVDLAVRVAVGSQADGATAVRLKIQRILDEVDSDALSMRCKKGYGPVKCNCKVPGFDTTVVNYGTDIPNLEGEHTRYLYGPGSILVAHGARENLTVVDLETAVEGYKKLILHALGH